MVQWCQYFLNDTGRHYFVSPLCFLFYLHEELMVIEWTTGPFQTSHSCTDYFCSVFIPLWRSLSFDYYWNQHYYYSEVMQLLRYCGLCNHSFPCDRKGELNRMRACSNMFLYTFSSSNLSPEPSEKWSYQIRVCPNPLNSKSD